MWRNHSYTWAHLIVGEIVCDSKSISNGAQYVTPDSKVFVKKSKCASLAQEIGFSAPNLCILPTLVKGTTQLCTSQKECNELHLTAAQYF